MDLDRDTSTHQPTTGQTVVVVAVTWKGTEFLRDTDDWLDASTKWDGNDRRPGFGLGPAHRTYLAVGAPDLRKGFEGLYDLVGDRLCCEPMSGHLFLFSKRLTNYTFGADLR